MLNLPLEVAGIILDEIPGDANRLLACSLVSRSWLHASRSYDPSFTRLNLYVDSPSAQKVVDILEGPSCTFVPYVRKLTIFPSKKIPTPESEVFLRQAITKLGNLPGVQTLWIHHCPHIIHEDIRKLITTTFSHITSLRILNAYPSLADAVQFVGSFTKLEQLDLDPYFLTPDDAPSGDLYLPKSLCSLRLHDSALRGQERQFADNGAGSKLITLTLSGIRKAADAVAANQILQRFGKDLLDLTLRFQGYEDLKVNLAQTTELRRLKLIHEVTTFSGTLNEPGFRRKITPILSSLRAPHLEQLMWWINITIAAEQIPELDALLASRSVFPALTRFSISGPAVARLQGDITMPKIESVGIWTVIREDA